MKLLPPEASAPPFLAVEEIAALLQVSIRTVWRLRSEGRIPAPVKLRGSVRWNTAVFRRWIAEGCPPVERADERMA